MNRKNRYFRYSLLLLCFLFTAFQCGDCETSDAYLDGSRSWLPLKGKTHLSFLDSSGKTTDFGLKVVDTTQVIVNHYCNTSSVQEYILASLYLNAEKTDSLYFSLSPQAWMCMRGTTHDTTNIFACNAFKESSASKRFTHYTVGNRNYEEVFLLKSTPGYMNKIDSVFMANNVGIVGFTYAGEKYALP